MPMTISTAPKRRDPQSVLFDSRGVVTLGAARYHIGDFFEGVTAKWLRAVQLKTDGRFDICPDIWDRLDDAYIECKSIGLSGTSILYDIRIEKDRKLVDMIAQEKKRLRYVFWRHTLAINQQLAASRALVDLQDALRRSIVQVCVVDFADLESLCHSLPTRVLNTAQIQSGENKGDRLGYGSKGYGRGWSIPYSRLVDIAMYSEGWSTWK